MSNKFISKTLSKKQIFWRAIGTLALSLICLVFLFPSYANKSINWVNSSSGIGIPTLPETGFNLGLDLQGGAHLVYQADVSNIDTTEIDNSVEGVRDVIERRVRGGLGVSEPLVQTTKVGEDYRIIVELPGVNNISDAIKMIGETPVLEFKEQNNEPPRDLTKEEQQQLIDYNDNADYKIKNIYDELKLGASFDDMVEKYSENKSEINGYMGFITPDTYKEIYAWAHNKGKAGEYSDAAIQDADGLSIAKLLSEKQGEKKVYANHLLICYRGASYCDSQLSKEEALAKINELKAEATPENFIDLVKANSTEPGADETGGDLGGFKSGEMVKEFEDAVWDQPVGTISNVVETEFGYHLIYKTDEQYETEYEIQRIFIDTMQASDIVPPADPWKNTGLSGKQLKKAEVVQDTRTGEIQVNLLFDEEGTQLFADITERNVGSPVAIYLDGQPLSIPTVNEPIKDGNAVISGGFTWEDARLLAQRLNSGALPVAVELISQQTVDASLGKDSLTMSFKAAMVGIILVGLFMIGFYRLAGLLSVIALAVYGLLTLTIFKLLGVTLTLSGIAGFVLSVGMAVDANVLIFERLKEELQDGKSMALAIEEAFVRAWTSIRDGNITTLISCVFLIWFASGFVQGFAVTLAIGVLMSMFTAIIITRSLMRLVFSWIDEKKFPWLFLGAGQKKNQ